VAQLRHRGATGTNLRYTRQEIKSRQNLRNVYYLSRRIILSPRLLFKNVNINKTLDLCENWSFTLWEELKRVAGGCLKNRALRVIFELERLGVTGERRKVRIDAVRNLYSSDALLILRVWPRRMLKLFRHFGVRFSSLLEGE
jgi:hypothetical protein